MSVQFLRAHVYTNHLAAIFYMFETKFALGLSLQFIERLSNEKEKNNNNTKQTDGKKVQVLFFQAMTFRNIFTRGINDKTQRKKKNLVKIIAKRLKCCVIHVAKLPHLIWVISSASTQNHLFLSIDIQTEAVIFVDDPFVFLKHKKKGLH